MWWILSSIFLSQWTAVVIVLILLLYRWGTAHYKFFEERQIEYERPYPFVGNLWSIVRQKENFVEILERLYTKYKHKK